MRWQGLSLEGMPRAAPKDLALLEPDRWSAGHLEAVCVAIANFKVLS